MALREAINQKKSLSVGAAVLLLVVAGAYLAYTQWPERRPKGDMAFYTVDEGQTWFKDSIYKTPPFDQDGKTAVRAMVYSYDNGHKRFCPLLQRYTAATKKKLDEAISQANHDGKPLSSIALFNSPEVIAGVEIKLPGSGHQWVPRSNLTEIMKLSDEALKSPDGSRLDFVIP